MKTIIKKALPEYKKDFAKLILISAPYFPLLFGKKIEQILQQLFIHPKNLFSFKHTFFAKNNKRCIGMVLVYSGKDKKSENLTTGILLFKKTGFFLIKKILTLMKFNATIGQIKNNEFYISNLAVYPNYRKIGIGQKLIKIIEKQAISSKTKKIILDVEHNNNQDINLYKKLKYKKKKKFFIPIQKGKILSFYRMEKEIT